MAESSKVTIDGNEAAARVAYLTNEVIAIYPITPASPMGELADEWASLGHKNLWGVTPQIIEMQSEGGAAGAVHGALQSGALTTTFTASQGLLLMIPNMYKIAGELTPAVFHVAARSLAAQALSIFGDHSDVTAARATGFAFLAANSVQEVMDFALIAQAATLEARVPFVHFFDGFRTSHEITKVDPLGEDVIRALINDNRVRAHRARALSPEHPVLRGSSQNPDVYFQARESVNPFYHLMPGMVQSVMDRFAEQTGRRYHLFDYVGPPDAERVLVLMGSGAEAAHETVEHMVAHGEKVGVVKVRLFRPFSPEAFLQAVPATARRVAVLDRTKESGADGEPLYKDIVTAFARNAMVTGSSAAVWEGRLPLVVGGRYGLSSKEFTPGMIKGVFDELKSDEPRHPFTVGIVDDVTNTSLDWDPHFRTDAAKRMSHAVFFGLGADGTVGANKNSIKIIGEHTDLHAQGYFVYDSKKAGARTVSHLRFGPEPIRSAYLIGDGEASFVACHQPTFPERYEMLDKAAEGAVFLLNSPALPGEVWDTLPRDMQRQLIDKHLSFYVIDAYKVAAGAGMGRRINTIMQACFFAISGILPREQAIEAIKEAAKRTYAKAGPRILEANIKAIDAALENLHRVEIGAEVTSTIEPSPPVPDEAPEFARRVTARMIAERGDGIPVSLMPADGTFPVGTGAYEKRNLALEIPVWEPDICTQCGKCVFVCPHATIRSKLFPAELAEDAPPAFKHVPVRSKGYEEGLHIAYQVAPEDCTGCTLCVDVCPIRDKQNPQRKAINMAPQRPLREQERENWAFFERLPDYDRSKIKHTTIPGSMALSPLFEFSSACVGCGETPYIRLATQLFGDRMVVANATGCSSIYGGNLPTTPWTKNAEGRGPAWSNSLFEDNAEFGFGMRLAVDELAESARERLAALRPELGEALVDALLGADQSDEAGVYEQRERVEEVCRRLTELDGPQARLLESVAEYLIRRSVWIIGGDGWAYDIGYGGLDHVLASGRDVNILVLDTEVYSNTGGQTSKATPLGAVAKFSAAGKPVVKKDLARIAMDYEHVYVAQVAFGAKDTQTLRAFLEAESYPGPSLIIAFSPCIAHGVDLSYNLRQQDLAVRSGHWPLLRYDPRRAAEGKNPLRVDSARPSIPYRDYAATEARFNVLTRTHPEEAERFMAEAQHDVLERYHRYEQLAGLSYKEEDEETPPPGKKE
ncbi:MAG: pyruvate:ferredoxin (flavodoxin) oxidoreductase [Gammaproteobacteria bacterium]|nr:pyruvate:ferredoxin (flavodoxin) oxidoreductase [Gammaproteobacteria bacterium]NIR98849.1 pyruvate:ferredoxin (flavodoxin) oxidoreductase [Gammaproteobacteria bacterium]NIT63970.1 pyruvate:ferredoxin (flavodoxin) oxidoreductase [Gammaproteobacteria bacterium]NIV19130.1 pyruvate:ferredoxin (flavodoxin) oxidoreductase [Gammaproteobacteria bacterium]NIX10299.1 pyruvate:ferredoxin (flavodoxin) oxidoreductase [Gammaproteobacteria bacterium]